MGYRSDEAGVVVAGCAGVVLVVCAGVVLVVCAGAVSTVCAGAVLAAVTEGGSVRFVAPPSPGGRRYFPSPSETEHPVNAAAPAAMTTIGPTTDPATDPTVNPATRAAVARIPTIRRRVVRRSAVCRRAVRRRAVTPQLGLASPSVIFTAPS